ncbi:MAG: class I SAM-dependent methyltransferase [Candidatus Methylacidiphilaceae bacterium]
MNRIVEPEWIDRLDPESPEARRTRRELRRMNALMRNFDWFRRRLADRPSLSGRGLEIGAGDGGLGAYLFADPTTRRRFEFVGIDRVGRPPAWPRDWRWEQKDVFQLDNWHEFPLLLANMVLHHFSEEELARLGFRIRESCRVLLALETARRGVHLAQVRVLRTLGILGPVGYHDASTSIQAGFIAEELPRLLGLPPSEWRWQIHLTFFGAYQLVAERR